MGASHHETVYEIVTRETQVVKDMSRAEKTTPVKVNVTCAYCGCLSRDARPHNPLSRASSGEVGPVSDLSALSAHAAGLTNLILDIRIQPPVD